MIVPVVPAAFPHGVLTHRDLDVRIGSRPGGVTDRHLAWWAGRCRRHRHRSDTDGPTEQRPDDGDPQPRRTMRSPRWLVHVFLHCSGYETHLPHERPRPRRPRRSWRSLSPDVPTSGNHPNSGKPRRRLPRTGPTVRPTRLRGERKSWRAASSNSDERLVVCAGHTNRCWLAPSGGILGRRRRFGPVKVRVARCRHALYGRRDFAWLAST